jgi:hypothetical protein
LKEKMAGQKHLKAARPKMARETLNVRLYMRCASPIKETAQAVSRVQKMWV